MRKRLIVFFTFLGGVYFFLEFVLPKSTNFGKYHDQITQGFICVSIMAIFLGVINILRSHGINIMLRRQRWGYSLALVAAMFGTMVVGFWDWHNSEASRDIAKARRKMQQANYGKAKKAWEDGGKKGEAPDPKAKLSLTAEQKTQLDNMKPGSASMALGYIYKEVLMGLGGLFTGLSSAMFSLLAVYIAAAAYRAFRIRSGEAALMMVTALLVMMGQIPFGSQWLDPTFHAFGVEGGITAARGWIMKYINAAAFRGIAFGAFVAMLAMGIRVWLSMDMSSYYKEEE